MLKSTLEFLKKLTNHPKKVFLLDAMGALLTVSLLFSILAQFPQYFGMPIPTLYFLSGVAFFFFVYSISCHFFISNNWRPFLILIICFNFIYSITSFTLVLYYSESLTLLGWGYFIVEIIIICMVVLLEYNSLKQYLSNSTKIQS